MSAGGVASKSQFPNYPYSCQRLLHMIIHTVQGKVKGALPLHAFTYECMAQNASLANEHYSLPSLPLEERDESRPGFCAAIRLRCYDRRCITSTMVMPIRNAAAYALRPLGPLGMLCPPLKRPRIVTKTTTSVPTSHSRSHTRTRLVVTLTIVVRVPYRVVTVVTHTYLPYRPVGCLDNLPAGDVKEWPSKAPGPKKANLIRSTSQKAGTRELPPPVSQGRRGASKASKTGGGS